ncbi:MAG: carboxypeptidase regulatory-like domain-containing protein [Terriglobia bacterium]
MKRDSTVKVLRNSVLLLFATIYLSAVGAWAQVDRGAIAGTVTDASGAVVPNATITLTNLGVGQSTKLTTDESGGYVANLLRIGKYTVTAEAEGFSKTVQENVEVGVNQVVRVDLTLQVGSTTQTVEVTGAPPLVQSETSSLGTIETERRIVDLPLNGRNFIALAYLGPGANSGQQGTNVSGGVFENERGNEALSVNGLRVSNNNFLLDGVDNNEFGLGGVIAMPPPDAIQEFRIEENSMSAEFGRGGAAVNVAIKSGTNEIHGGAYEFIRNDKLDAANFFDNVAGLEKPSFRRNQFGFFLGGPIRKNQTFVFGDYQGIRIRQGLTFVNTVPSAGEQQGDFSGRLTGSTFSPCPSPGAGDPTFDEGAIFDPATTRSFTCSDGTPIVLRDQFSYLGQPNIIPPDRINAVGQNIANLYPAPNIPGAGFFDNYALNPKLTNDQDSFDLRIDHRFREGDQIFGHYSFGDVDSHRPGPLGDLGGDYCCQSNSKNRAQHYAAGWTHTLSPTLLNDLHGGFFRYHVAGLPLNFGTNASQGLGISNANRGDETSSGLSFIEVANYQPLGDSLWTPEFVVENIFQVADTLSWVRGKHSLKFGMDFRRQQRNFFQTTAPAGWFGFYGQYSTDLTTGTGGSGLADTLLGVPSYFEQDNLRGEYPTRYWDLAGFVQDDFHVTPNLTLNLGLRYEVVSPVNGRIGNFDLAKAMVVNAEGPNGVPHAGVQYDKNNFGPRIGLAWSPFSGKRTVVRSAFGIFYSQEGNIFDDLGLNPPYLSVESQSFSAGVIPAAGQYIDTVLPATVVFPDPNSPSGTVRTNGPKRVIPNIMEWNFNLQQELGHDWVAQAAYVGTRGVHLWNHESGNLNQPRLPLDSNFSDGNFGRPYYDRLPGLDTILPWNFPMLSLAYHAFQASVTKRFSNGFNMLASYTFAKNLGTADGNVGTVAIQNIYDIASAKGPVPPDLRQRFVVSYLYELPFGKGRRFLSSMSGPVEAILGGWQVSGITSLRSGEAYTAFLSDGQTNTGAGGWPDRIHDPYDFSFGTDVQASMGCPNPGHQTRECFYNQAAFVLPPLAPGQTFAHQFGDGGRSNLRGPDQRNFDFAFLKNFKLTERHQLQFRAEFFNLWNTPQFALPDGTVDSPGGASISSTVPDNQREVQLALKWTF